MMVPEGGDTMNDSIKDKAGTASADDIVGILPGVPTATEHEE